MDKVKVFFLSFAFGLLHLVLSVVVAVVVAMAKMGESWGDGATHGPGAPSQLYLFVFQPLLALFCWLTGQMKPLASHHISTFLLAVDLLVAIASSFLFGLFVALFFLRKRRSQ